MSSLPEVSEPRGAALPVDQVRQPPALRASRSVVTPPAASVVSIAPAHPWPGINAREIWSRRNLARFLVWRDIKVRYSQTVLGAAWAVLQPLAVMAVFTVIFGRFVRVSSEGVPYAVFALTALVPWTFFSAALFGASNSLVANTNLLTKIYFPRLILPLAPVLAGLLDLAIGVAVLLLFMLLRYGMVPTPVALVVVPLATLTMICISLGVGCGLAALNIQYRDVRHMTPVLVQIWMYASPVVYSLSVVPPEHRALYALNPMVGVIAAFRWSLLGTLPPSPAVMASSFSVGVLLLVVGSLYFRRTERLFADVA